MNTEPLATALRAITETKQLLDSLITSSETFEYREAQRALKALGRKARELGKLQARMQSNHRRRIAGLPNVYVVDFQNPASARDSRAR